MYCQQVNTRLLVTSRNDGFPYINLLIRFEMVSIYVALRLNRVIPSLNITLLKPSSISVHTGITIYFYVKDKTTLIWECKLCQTL